MRRPPGQPLLIRYVQGGRLYGALPVTVVQDDDELTVVWLAPGTVVGRAVPVTGERRMRDLPLDRLFSTPWRVERQPWHGQGILRLHPAGAAHSVWLFWAPDGRFRGWYVNLERPHAREDGCVDTADWILDLWVEADGRWRWKDEDEVPVAVAAGFLSADEAAAARREGERVLAEWPFPTGWEAFRPDPSWPVPDLPAGLVSA